MGVFHRMRVDEVVGLDGYAYTTLNGGLSEHGYADHGWELYEQMKNMAHGHEPSPVMYSVMMQWYCKSKWIGAAMALYGEMVSGST
mgnify:CR=1 FL=1